MARILVTDGARFLGSHLCESLLDGGNDVLFADNFFTGTRSNVIPLLADPRFGLVRHDITFPLYVEMEQIYNLACPASPIHYRFDLVQTTKTCVHGAINILGLAKRIRSRILQASTSECMAILRSIRRPRTTGAGSICSGRAPAMTKASA